MPKSPTVRTVQRSIPPLSVLQVSSIRYSRKPSAARKPSLKDWTICASPRGLICCGNSASRWSHKRWLVFRYGANALPKFALFALLTMDFMTAVSNSTLRGLKRSRPSDSPTILQPRDDGMSWQVSRNLTSLSRLALPRAVRLCATR